MRRIRKPCLSSVKNLSNKCLVIKFIIAYNYFMPEKIKTNIYYITIALLLILVAAVLFIPFVWIPFCRTGLVERFPTLIGCGFITVAALLSFFNGMVLDSIKQKERREFEFRLSLLHILQNQKADHRQD